MPEMRQHRMRGITKQGKPPLGPGRQRFAIVQRPFERRLHLPQQAFDARIPAGEFRAQRVWIALGGP
jgi:hypothetical protein